MEVRPKFGYWKNLFVAMGIHIKAAFIYYLFRKEYKNCMKNFLFLLNLT